MVRAQEITRPSRARFAACSRLAGVIRLSVPRSSSAPQRPQLLSEAYQPRISCSVGIVRTAVTDDQLTRSAVSSTECSVILSEASLRAKSKDPLPVASVGVADPSQAQDDTQRV